MNAARLFFGLVLGRRLPRTRGTCPVAGIRDAVRIQRDGWGVPHIEAQNGPDAWFGLGFCHGQDRAFQLELLLRIQRGCLAELAGAAALPVDRLSRRIGFHHSATLQLPAVADDVRATLDAYTAGVTQGATAGSPRRAHEFALLRIWPTPWTSADVLGVLKLQSFLLSSNWDAELVRLKVLLEDGPEALAAADPQSPEWLNVTAPPGAAAGPFLDLLAAELQAFVAVTGVGGGSNNWALRSSRTATGRPLLANDPHLSAALPSHWYLAHVRTPDWAVAGASFAGIPAIAVGHNGHAAWGLTAGLVDNTDLFREQIGPDGRSVLQDGTLIPCPVRREVIRVKGGPDAIEEVLATPRGPVVSPSLSAGGEALSLRATWLDATPAGGLFRLHGVRSFAEFRRAFEHWPFGSLNMVYADASGSAGWQLAGLAPRRRLGHGLIPQPGWEAGAGWHAQGVPFEDMPHFGCDARDFVATANTAPGPEGSGPYFGCDWIDGFRLTAIVEALSARRDWDVPSTLALQTSVRARAWDDVRQIILSLTPENATPVEQASSLAQQRASEDACSTVRQGLELLRGWDGMASAHSPAAAVYELFLAEMAVRVCREKAPRSFEWAVGRAVIPLTPLNFFGHRRTGHLVRLIREQPAGWFAGSWDEEMRAALARAVGQLRARFGSDPARWGWGRVRTLTMHHALGRSRLLGRVFNLGPVPCGGDTDTINQASVPPLTPLAPADNIASLRAVIDVGAWNNSRFVLPGGQSGNPCSRHYGDQFALWQRGEGIPIPWSSEEVRAAARQTLELVAAVR